MHLMGPFISNQAVTVTSQMLADKQEQRCISHPPLQTTPKPQLLPFFPPHARLWPMGFVL